MGVDDGQGSLACYSPWGCKELDVTEWLNWTESLICTKKKKKKGHGHCLVIWAGLIRCSFLNPSETTTSEKYAQQITEMHWKLQCPPLAFVNKKEPNSPRQCLSTCRTTNTSKVEWIGLQSFALSNIFTWFLGNTLPLLQASWQCFAGKMLPQPTGGRKCFPRVPRTTDFYATGINKLIGKKCVVGNGVYFDY